MTEGKIVTVETYGDEMEAQVALAELKANGIRGMTSADDCGGLRPALTFTTGVELKVLESDLLQARRILGLGE